MYKKIMVPLDGSSLAECVLPHVERIVTGCSVPSVTFVHVVEPIRPFGGDEGFSAQDWARFEERHKADAKTYLGQVVSRIKWPGVTVKSQVLSGKVAETLVDFAEKNGIDLVVIATHGRSGISRWVWGSVAEKLLRSLKAPVLMIRAKE